MRSRKMSQGAVWLLLIFIVGLAVPAVALEDEILVINEVLADPATDWDGDGVVDAKGDEWIEIINVSNAPVNIGNWWLRDLAGDAPDLHLSGLLDPGRPGCSTVPRRWPGKSPRVCRPPDFPSTTPAIS